MNNLHLFSEDFFRTPQEAAVREKRLTDLLALIDSAGLFCSKEMHELDQRLSPYPDGIRHYITAQMMRQVNGAFYAKSTDFWSSIAVPCGSGLGLVLLTCHHIVSSTWTAIFPWFSIWFAWGGLGIAAITVSVKLGYLAQEAKYWYHCDKLRRLVIELQIHDLYWRATANRAP